jgi:[ribosomal protein S18]-alanine N-acetyltransferase
LARPSPPACCGAGTLETQQAALREKLSGRHDGTMSKLKGIDIAIRPLADEAEARICAGFIAASEPWVTLGLEFDHAMSRLTDPAREVFAATVDDQIVGALVLHLAGPLNGYIQIIAVHPDWRCRGIGTRIIQFAEERIFRQSPNVFLCVSSFNWHAQRFYERLGYARIGELPDFLRAGLSEILLRKTRGPLYEFKSVR